jgi:hypothetical protein
LRFNFFVDKKLKIIPKKKKRAGGFTELKKFTDIKKFKNYRSERAFKYHVTIFKLPLSHVTFLSLPPSL